MRRLATLYIVLSACGPVLLYGDRDCESPTAGSSARLDMDAATQDAAGALATGEPMAGSAAAPRAVIQVQPVDCGKCFDLTADGADGVPPYRFEWDDGSQNARRRVCADSQAAEITLVVLDSTSARSSVYVAKLEAEEDAACPLLPEPPVKLCLMNPSFEGMPAMNVGLPETFDAAPWSMCTNPAVMSSTQNTPDIVSATLAPTFPGIPNATQGDTFLSLSEGEQISQQLCDTVPVGRDSYIALDLARFDIGTGVSEKVFLEISGGVAADCSQRQLLWASPALDLGWKRYCVPLKPTAFMDQITLQAKADMSSLALGYLVVDNIVPVDSCP